MKKILSIILLGSAALANAQVIIGDATGTAAVKTSVLLDFAAEQNKGLILPYVRTLPTATAATAGTLLLDAGTPTAARVKFSDGSSWIDLSGQDADVTAALAAQPTGITETDSKTIIGAGTSAADGVLVLESAAKAMILPIVADVQDIASPSPGMMVYVNAAGAKRLAVYNGNKWSFWRSGNNNTVRSVTSPTGKIWMDRNLGATQVATSATDEAAYGDLYQWGRGADGHQLRTSGTTPVLSSTDVPGHGNFIVTNSGNLNWRSPSNNNLWQGVNGINNPCPTGYRLPTMTELANERSTFGPSNAAGAFASPLKLTLTGRRDVGGTINYMGSDGYGFYWSSTVSNVNSQTIFFDSYGIYLGGFNRGYGLSVRCIKD